MKVNELFSQLQLPVKSHMPSFDGANAWLNTEPLTADALRGKVVAVDFWTFTCINWLRTLPYIRAWANTYSDKGLVVIGVHTPEFGVEHDLDNVRRAVRAMGIEVVLDAELGRVHADDDEPLVGIRVRPRADVRQRAQPVDARERPEVDRDDLAAQRVSRQRLGVQPRVRTVERRHVAF